MKIYLFGTGKMGKLIARLAQERGEVVVGSLEEAHVAIDFSHASVVKTHVDLAIAAKVPIVIGTTGWEKELDTIKEAIENSEIAALYAPNFSRGVAAFIALLQKSTQLFPSSEIVGEEIHHTEKKDAPSGTAKLIAALLEMEKPFSSKRENAVCGTHTVTFNSPVETITITHAAHSREGFALGALEAAGWIQDKKGWQTLDALYSTHHPLSC